MVSACVTCPTPTGSRPLPSLHKKVIWNDFSLIYELPRTWYENRVLMMISCHREGASFVKYRIKQSLFRSWAVGRERCSGNWQKQAQRWNGIITTPPTLFSHTAALSFTKIKAANGYSVKKNSVENLNSNEIPISQAEYLTFKIKDKRET